MKLMVVVVKQNLVELNMLHFIVMEELELKMLKLIRHMVVTTLLKSVGWELILQIPKSVIKQR